MTCPYCMYFYYVIAPSSGRRQDTHIRHSVTLGKRTRDAERNCSDEEDEDNAAPSHSQKLCKIPRIYKYSM